MHSKVNCQLQFARYLDLGIYHSMLLAACGQELVDFRPGGYEVNSAVNVVNCC